MVSEEDKQKIDEMYNVFKDKIFDILRDVINASNIIESEKITLFTDIFPPTCEIFKSVVVAHVTCLSSVINTHKIEMTKKNKEIESLNNNLLENYEYINKLKNMLDTSRNFINEKMAETEVIIKERIDNINVLDTTVNDLNVIIKEQDKSMQNIHNHNICLQNKIELIQISCDKYKQENQYLNKRINERDQELNSIYKENTRLQKEAENNLNKTNKLNSDVNSQMQQIQTQCQQQIEMTQAKLEKMTKNAENLKEYINKLEIENNKKNLQKKITKLEANIIILSKENDELNTKLNKINYGEGALARLFDRLAKDKFVYYMLCDINMTRINAEIQENEN
jgi:chromosome segregation ATPase